MTVIVGLVAEHAVLLASDTAAVDGADVIRPNPHKVRAITIAGGERLTFGTCGKASLGAAIEYGLKVDETPDPADDLACNAWAHALAVAITELAKDASVVDSNGMDGAALLGWRQRLWHVTDHLALPVERMSAIGSGGEIALGALDVLLDDPDHNPEVVVRRAVDAAVRWEAGCRTPTPTVVLSTL